MQYYTDNTEIPATDSLFYEIYVKETETFSDGDDCVVVAREQTSYQLASYAPLQLETGKRYFLSLRTVVNGVKSDFAVPVSFTY